MAPTKVIPEVLKQAIFDNLTMDPIELVKSRLRAIVIIKEMAHSLQVQEMDIKRSLTSEVAEVLATKRIALWEALLRAPQFPGQNGSSETRGRIDWLYTSFTSFSL